MGFQQRSERLNGVLFIDALGEDIPEGGSTVPDVRLRLTIFRNTGRRMSVNSKMSLVEAGSTVTVVDFDLRNEFQDLVFGDSMKTREHVTGMNTGSDVF